MARPHNKRRLSLECLEDRQLLAGNVTAILRVDGLGSNLYIDGDSNANRITVESIGAGKVQVRGFSDAAGLPTSVNGGANALRIFSGVANGIFIHMNGGNDLVRVTNLGIGGDLLVDLGVGNDEAVLGRDQVGGDARFANTASGPLFINNGNLQVLGGVGNDLVFQSDEHVHGEASIDLGDGNDTVLMRRPPGSGQNVEYFSVTNIDTDLGADTVDIIGLIVDGNCYIDDTIGNPLGLLNTLNLNLSSADVCGSLRIFGDAYNDIINVSAVNVLFTLNVSTGFGNNTVGLSVIANNVVVSFDNGNDTLYLLNCNLGFVNVAGLDGNDLFDVRNVIVDNAYFDGGFGSDTFRTSGTQKNRFNSLTVVNVP